MADADQPVFENDAELEAYLTDPGRSECLAKSLDWLDAVDSFKKGTADIIRPTADSDKWSAYVLYPEFEGYRRAADEMTRRLRKGIFDRSRA